MNQHLTLKTRRAFLRTSVLGGALTCTIPGFLSRTFSELEAQAAASAAPITGRDAPILVVLQMAGGNDGLNTVVPHANDYYHRARPRLAFQSQVLHRIDDELGWHPALTGFASLMDEGHMTVLQGVGYPNPNRSHFRSTEIWQTASDANRSERHGWLGRYFDNCCSGADATVGLNIGRRQPQAFAAATAKGVTVENPGAYRLAGLDPSDGLDPEETSLSELNRPRSMDTGMTESGASIGELPGRAPAPASALDYVERTALDAQLSSERIRELAGRARNQAEYPGSGLANRLKLVARLIAGGLPTRVYYVSQGGYDTHTNQAPTQARLLQELGDAVQAFAKDLQSQGNFERVLLMTFSEFGRRVKENANQGTDHGAAAPLFMVGSRLRAGLIGSLPSLAPEDLERGDLRFKIDFRSVYAAVLEQWLGVDSKRVLGRRFQPVRLI